MSYETPTVEVSDRLAVVTIDRPDVRNALIRQCDDEAGTR